MMKMPRLKATLSRSKGGQVAVEQIIWGPEEEKPEKSQLSMDVVGRVK